MTDQLAALCAEVEEGRKRRVRLREGKECPFIFKS